MKIVKKMWAENRVLFALFMIVLICVFVILGVMINYFFGVSKSSYGERLQGIEEVEINDEFKNKFILFVKEDNVVNDATIKTRGKIIYITLSFKEGVSLEDAKNKASASLTTVEQKYLDFYDFNYTLKGAAVENGEGFLIMGARNVNGNGLVWNNNTQVVKKEE